MSDAIDPRREAIALVVVLVGLVLGGLWLPVDGLPLDRSATDAPSVTRVDSCTTITDPGRYELTADVTDSNASICFRIQSDGVVLAGGGHRIDGVGTFGTAGVVARSNTARPLTNVTVRNVTVTDWDDGIRYINVADGAVLRTTTSNNRVGLSLLNTRGSRLAENVARGNRLRGISVLESCTNNTLVNNTAIGNALFGIHLVEGGVQNNTLVSNTATGNEFGIVLIGVYDNTVVGNSATANRIAGIWLSAARGNRLDRNTVSNRFYGIFLADSSRENEVSNNTATSNPVGIRLRSSDNNTIASNTVRSSTDTAILLISSDDNVISRNVGGNNAHAITIIRSTGNTRTNNSIS